MNGFRRGLKSFGICCIVSLLCIVSLRATADINPIPVDQAFQFSAMAKDSQTLVMQWNIAKGYYLYRERIHIKPVNPKTTSLGQPIFPHGIKKHDDLLGDYQVYAESAKVGVPLVNAPGDTVAVQVQYQGCSSEGYCYPPTTRVAKLDISGNFMTPVKGYEVDLPPSKMHQLKDKITTASSMDHVTQMLSNSSFPLILLGFFGFGLLLAFTPCILPMIPILSSIILGQKNYRR